MVHLMRILRRRLASGALALTALQLALLFAVPVSACCASSAVRSAVGAAASDDAPDCCPPGAHPKGECPLHRARTSDGGGQKRVHCKWTCGPSSGPQLVLGAIGVLPAPTAIVVPVDQPAAPEVASLVIPLRPSVPDAPPPRLL
jgi:hypothetical protein